MPRPIVRAQNDDDGRPTPRPVAIEQRPTPLQLPSPEQLGVSADSTPAANAARPTAANWAALHQRLEQVGATCFHKERLASGLCRVTCLIPTGQPDRQRRIEVQAASEMEALDLTMAQLNAWSPRH
jgi:hypothetical protein